MGSIKNMTFDFTNPAVPILEFTSYPGASNNRMLKEISFTVTKKDVQIGMQTIGPAVFLTPISANAGIIESIYTGNASASTPQLANSYTYNIYDSSTAGSIINTSVFGNTWVKISGFAGDSSTRHTKTRIRLNNLYGTGFESNKQYAFDVRYTETTGGSTDVHTWSWNSQTTPTLLATNVDNYSTYVTGDTSDISLPAAPAEGADWGYQGVTPSGGTALVVTRLLASEIATGGGIINAKLQDGFGNEIPLPAGTKAMLLYASDSKLIPGGSNPDYYASPNLDTSQFTGGMSLGQPVDQITVNNLSTDPNSYITVGFALPVTQTGSNNSLVMGNTYNFLVKNIVNSSPTTLVETTAAPLTCLYEDTEVLTPFGYVSVKQLREGDEIITSDGRTSQIVKLSISKFGASSITSPVVIKANSIAENYPPKDCRISKYHMIQFNGEWIAPCKNEHIFKADESIRSIRYYHIQLENFKTDHLVINGGLVVESLGNGQEDNCAEWEFRCNNSIIL